MKLDSFIAGVVGFNAAVKSGAVQQLNPIEPIVAGAGLPIWPIYALREASMIAPNPQALAAEVMRGIEAAVPAVRAAGIALQTVGVVGGALVPLAGVIGPALAPAADAALPGLGSVATAAGPIVAVGAAAAGAAGGLASGAPDPKALGELGKQVADQLDSLKATSTVDDVIVVPQKEQV